MQLKDHRFGLFLFNFFSCSCYSCHQWDPLIALINGVDNVNHDLRFQKWAALSEFSSPNEYNNFLVEKVKQKQNKAFYKQITDALPAPFSLPFDFVTVPNHARLQTALKW